MTNDVNPGTATDQATAQPPGIGRHTSTPPAVEAAPPASAPPTAGPAPLATGAVPLTAEDIARDATRIGQAVSRVILGKPNVVRLALIALLTEGHLLIEDVPGTGKTNLAKAVAACVGASVSRVQFTPDLMPSDVTGVSVYHRDSGEFRFQPGPVFANILVADEINRASPKTQSALLEAMEERQVTVDGTTYPLSRPFLVLATQNPVEMEGTYPLPEAQRDRFLARTAIGYPDPASEVAMLADRDIADPLATLTPIVDTARVQQLVAAVHQIRLAPSLGRYIVAIIGATRTMPQVRLGCSPRAVLHLGRAAKAAAALAGRSYVVPDDIQHLAGPVLAHRLLLTVEAHAARRTAGQIIADILTHVPVPIGTDG